jgi:methanogenic corrinoid protein MtbC1
MNVADFSNIDLGTDRAMKRIVKAEREKHNAVVFLAAEIARVYSTQAADAILEQLTLKEEV